MTGTITDIQTQKHDVERVNIFIDGSFAFGTSAAAVLTRRLRLGTVLSEADVEALQREDGIERSYAAALNYVSFRPRSTRELRDYFSRRQTEPEIAFAVIERLTGAGLLDDAEFARFWVDNRQTFRPRGARALRAEMRQKGLSSDVIDAALQDLGDEEATAYTVGSKKSRSYASLSEREYRQKMIGFLQRRGFSYEVAASATRQLWAELGEVTSDPAE
ncbi:MAG: RecX family transcriptional regulator [Chloroflexota bacterium]